MLATGDHQGRVRLWEASPPALPATLEPAVPVPHLSHDNGLRVCGTLPPDAHAVLTSDGELREWAPDTRELRWTLRVDDPISCAIYAPDGATVAVGTRRGSVTLFARGGSQSLRSAKAVDGVVLSLAFSPDGRMLAVGGTGAQCVLLGGKTLEMRQRLETARIAGEYAVFSPDGELLAMSCREGTVMLAEVSSGQVKATLHTGVAYGVDFTPDGGLLAVSTGRWQNDLWDVERAALVRSLRGHSGGCYGAIAFAPDGKTLATGSVDKTLRLWQVSTGHEMMLWRFPAHVRNLAFARDGSFLQVLTCDGKLTVFPAASAQQVGERD
jgi:WD40 repeat protein